MSHQDILIVPLVQVSLNIFIISYLLTARVFSFSIQPWALQHLHAVPDVCDISESMSQ